MALPLPYQISMASQAVPLVAYLASRRRTSPAAALVLGALVSVVANLIGRIMAATVQNNQVVTYISSPITAVCFFYALREWQLTPPERRAFRVGTWLFLGLWALLVAFLEDMRNFNVATGPLYSLTLLVAAAWTLIRRANAVEATPLLQSDWFWVSVGIAVYGACTAAAEPIGGILLARQRIDLFHVAWNIRAALSTLGFLLVSWGIYRGPAAQAFAMDD